LLDLGNRRIADMDSSGIDVQIVEPLEGGKARHFASYASLVSLVVPKRGQQVAAVMTRFA
jgi:hypothetical protein